MKLLCILMTLVAMAQTEMDTEFCQSNTPPATSNDKKATPIPDLPPDFTYVWESVDPSKNLVQNGYTVYSTTSQTVFQHTLEDSKDTKVYLLPKQDQSLTITISNKTGSNCESHPLGSSVEFWMYNLSYSQNGTISLPVSKYPMMQFSQSEEPSYIGETTIRGIPAEQWHVCGFQVWSQHTVSANFYYSQSNVSMPGSNTPVPLKVEAKMKNNETGQMYDLMIDFSDFQSSISPDSEIKTEIPFNTYCQQGPVAHNLPVTRSKFQFKAEEIDLGNLQQNPRPKPVLYYSKKTYIEQIGLFTMESENIGKNNTLVKHRTFQDFNTGVEYDLNVLNNKCSVREIDVAHDHITHDDETIKMSSPKQFFDIASNNYHYMGKHKDLNRDIEVDVFTSVKLAGTKQHPHNVIHSWFFATKHWVMNVMKSKEYFLLPVRLMIGTTDPMNAKSIDFYQFTRSPSGSSAYPDLSSCFPDGQKIHVNITLDVKREDITEIDKFLWDFRTALLNHSTLISSLRVDNVRILPLKGIKTIVHFLLLDKRQSSNSQFETKIQNEPNNRDLYNQIKKAVLSGNFVIDIPTKSSNLQAKATAISQYADKPFSPPTMKSDPKETGYSLVVLVGVGAGALVVGLVLGFVLSKTIKIFRRARSRSIGWHNLTEDAMEIE